jgi:hypothetical protein
MMAPDRPKNETEKSECRYPRRRLIVKQTRRSRGAGFFSAQYFFGNLSTPGRRHILRFETDWGTGLEK